MSCEICEYRERQWTTTGTLHPKLYPVPSVPLTLTLTLTLTLKPYLQLGAQRDDPALSLFLAPSRFSGPKRGAGCNVARATLGRNGCDHNAHSTHVAVALRHLHWVARGVARGCWRVSWAPGQPSRGSASFALEIH